MPIRRHVTGHGRPPIVFVHGFGCACSDWDAQVATLSRVYQTIAVDLPGHGESPGEAADCTVERYGSEVAALLEAEQLEGAVLVGHSMGCRVVTEAALRGAARVGGVVLVDGSQFAPAMTAVLSDAFARPAGYETLISTLFQDMFTGTSDRAVVDAVMGRAHRLPADIGRALLTDLLHYDVGRLTASLGRLRVPVMAIQTTTRGDTGRQTPLRPGQDTPYLAMLRTALPSIRIEILEDTGHFPQLEQPEATSALLASFVAALPGHRDAALPGHRDAALPGHQDAASSWIRAGQSLSRGS